MTLRSTTALLWTSSARRYAASAQLLESGTLPSVSELREAQLRSRQSDPSTAATGPSPSGVRIFRKELAEGNARSFLLSVDVSQKKILEMLNDFDNKRCMLCNESYLQWHSHIGGSIPHTARESIMFELLRAHCGTPTQIVDMWWERLHTSSKFDRIQSLSHRNSYKRKRRLLYLLTFLRDKKILRECFNVNQGAGGATALLANPAASSSRSWEFERLEWAGDNVVKYLFNNRINVLFPYSEGGIRGKLGYAQFMIDGNDGLARAYDYLELQKLTMSDRVVSKFKSDVVETLFGELQLYLWSTQHDWGTEYVQSPFSIEMIPLRALVRHVMEETAHCMVMYHLDFILHNLMKVIDDNKVLFVKADPSTANRGAREKEVNYHALGKKTDPSRGLTAHRQPLPSGGKDAYFQSTNYDGFKKVTAVGGLLPVPFAPKALTAVNSFLPHLQLLLAPLRCDGALPLIDDLTVSSAVVERSLTLAPHRDRAQGIAIKWDSSRLKDAQLVPELV